MDYDDQETPKLMLFADLRLSPENPGRMTPPLHSMASVPFRWEERPGKAIVVGDINTNELAVSKSLELPPRLLSFNTSAGKSSSKDIKLMTSPDTVLDNPYITDSVNEAASFRFMADVSPNDQDCKGRSLFGSSGRGRCNSRRRSLSFSFSNPEISSTSKEAPIDKIKRGRSLVVTLSQNHFWERLCGGLKQLIMPWTRKQEKNGF